MLMAQELHCHLCVWKEFSHLVWHMSHPWLFSHAPSSMSTSSSSPTYPTAQREHSVHPAHLQAPSVDKLRHQESLWREDLQSGGNPRTTTPTRSEPKELATVSRIEAYSGDPYQWNDAQKEFGEEDYRVPITEEVMEFGEFGNPVSIDSEISETSCFQSQMHFDDSVESIADSDLEDGELQRCWLHHCIPRKLRGNPMQWSCKRERGKCTTHSSRSKGQFEVSFIWRSESFGETRCIVFIWTGKSDQEFCVQKR